MSDRLCKALEYALTVTFDAAEAPARPSAKIHKLEQRLSADIIETVLLDYETGLRGSALGRKYGLHESTVRGLLNRHGLRPDNGMPGYALSQSEIAQAVELYGAGLSVKDVAQQLGRAYGSVHKFLVQSGVELRPATRRWKLTALQIDQAVRDYETGQSLMAISAGLPVEAEALRRALQNRGVVMRPAGRRVRPLRTPSADAAAATAAVPTVQIDVEQQERL